MSSLFEPLTEKFNRNCCENVGTRKSKSNRVLRSKENIFKLKHNKDLRKKLRKYKLRRNGQEDQDVLDVSHIFLSTLKIKSPKKRAEENIQFQKPENYIIKMVRKKQCMKTDRQDINLHIQNRKPTNAFKLLMDSRNKSIGGNSPGKEKVLDESKETENAEKRVLKIKRNLILEKLAEKKGSVVKKEAEELKDEYINLKMKKRAESLRNMIMNNNKNDKKKKISKSKSLFGGNKDLIIKRHKPQSLSEVDFLGTHINCMNVQEKVLNKEDEEFLKKLSPSIRKKENMLSYFQKVSNEIDSCGEPSGHLSTVQNDKIKVKVKSKIKMKVKNRSLINNNTKTSNLDKDKLKGVSEEMLLINEIKCDSAPLTIKVPSLKNCDNRKRKRQTEVAPTASNAIDSVTIVTDTLSSGRAKRNVKKPVKYSEDIELFSSDEELYIFTPKKKKIAVKSALEESRGIQKPVKHSEGKQLSSSDEELYILTPRKKKTVIKSTSEKSRGISKQEIQAKKSKKEKIISKEKEIKTKVNVKLAPIFTMKAQVDSKAVEAKQKFLQSGVPEKCKKNVKQQNNDFLQKICKFDTVVHVQQSIKSNVINSELSPNLFVEHYNEDFRIQNYDRIFKSLLKNDFKVDETTISNVNDIYDTLQNLKKTYPKFPVHRTYFLLKTKSKGDILKECNFVNMDDSIEIINNMQEFKSDNPDQLTWCDKYKAVSSNQIVGNFQSIKEIKKWLVTWTENKSYNKSSKKIMEESDLSDFYNPDSDSTDSFKATNNLLIVTGPVGSGKTSSIYAVAAELAIKVIEVNASSKRTGKIILQDLHEATQSHKVNRGNVSGKENSKSQEVIDSNQLTKTFKKRGRKKKIKECVAPKIETSSQQGHSQEIVRTAMSLILIDDADIVFDQDDGFCSAIAQLIHCSKRPVILVTSTLSCPHLQRFILSGNVILMKPLPPKVLGTWLDIMCLADSGLGWPGLGKICLDFYKGDIRKTINHLQFYVVSENRNITDKIDSQNLIFKLQNEENSCMSWADNESNDMYNHTGLLPALGDIAWRYFMSDTSNVMQSNGLFNIWWSLPNILHINKMVVLDKRCSSQIESISFIEDSISLADLLNKSNILSKPDLTCNPWYVSETDSICECESSETYNKCHGLSEDITMDLVLSSLDMVKRTFEAENETDITCYPDLSTKSERDKLINRHHNLSSSMNSVPILDRRALALDYWAAGRDICRSEKEKSDSNLRRKNRYTHYLKSMSTTHKTDMFDALADSLVFDHWK